MIAVGTFLMITKKKEKTEAGQSENTQSNEENSQNIPTIQKNPERKAKWQGSWLVYAVLSAVFASLTSILGKIGVEGIHSNLGTAIRTVVVLIMAWVVVFVTGKQATVKNIEKKEMGFICLPGCFFRFCLYHAVARLFLFYRRSPFAPRFRERPP